MHSAPFELTRARRAWTTSILALALAACAGSTTDPGESSTREERAIRAVTPELEPVVQANQHFAWSLYGALATPNQNLFFSPFSLQTALNQAALGAQGETALQMQQVLRIPEDSASFHAAYGELLADLSGDRGRGYQLLPANRLFGQEGFAFNPAFIGQLQRDYAAELESVDFAEDEARDRANAWVSDATDAQIPELIPPDGVDALTRLAILNAIYFEAGWHTAFDPKATANVPFLLESGEQVGVPVMHVTETFRVAADADFSVLVADYADRELAFWVILPQLRGQLAAVEQLLDAQRIEALSQSLSTTKLSFGLPRFELAGNVPVRQALVTLGMVQPFEPEADFSPMLASATENPGLFITDVFHQGRVQVDERGTTAAAATAVVIGKRSTQEAFLVDQPFVFLIRDSLTGSVLFVGRVADPR